MSYILRKKYLNKIKPFIDKPIVKVITGMRRVGKSTLLNMIQSELLTDVPPSHIIYINLESAQYLSVKNDLDLQKLIATRIQQIEGKIYFFFDEIQLVTHWERVINALRVDYDCDIYLTGSNSKLLSGELATLLAGRYVSFEVLPFTFSEFVNLYQTLNLSIQELFQLYVKIGGMPPLHYFNGEEEPSFKYLTDIYNTVVVKDILEYNSIRDVDVFNRILLFCLDNIGQSFSANSLRKYFMSEGRKVSVDTILNYLNFCQAAYLLKKAPRYDSVGKKLLTVEEKYYVTDHGFRQAVGFSNVASIERILENIVYIELLSRGFQVQVGRINNQEIDFIATRQDKTEYYQVSYLMGSEETRSREFGVYRLVKDNYPKFVLSMDTINFSQEGIIHKYLPDFLLEKDA
ncbi:ATP-binding protein [Fannyhessea vaginae]|uniref:ATP-binding protein n=1 Tax=Fannyhessea vaginae TaxID=82135 RepID=UPI003A80E85B